ncbi:MAG: helix-turn-helix transcriptional regulator [Actinomycetota bacterium]
MHEPLQEWVTRAPAGPLRSFVDRYVGYRLAGFSPGLHRGLPSQHMTFIVAIGQTIDVAAQSDPAQSPQSYGCVLSGLQASAALIAHDGNQEGVAIELTPLGSRTLLGMPAGELWDLSSEFADVVGGAGAELWERLQVTAGWEQRFEVCDDVLSSLVGGDLIAPELRCCWGTLVASGGRISVSDLAAETGYSRQHLGRRFRSEFGLSPKLAARVIRFERAGGMLQSVPWFVSIAQVAAACGYYDQAHLYRDFTELAGCTPTELLGEDLPFFQDDLTPDESQLLHD